MRHAHSAAPRVLGGLLSLCALLGAKRGPTARREIAAAEVAAGAVRIDGALDEDVWRRATPANGFMQSEPHEGEPATEATEVRIAYDADQLYIGAYLHDREPGKVIVSDIRKDFDESDQDDFEVILDTFGDRRNGYVFLTNAEGARADRQVTNEGRDINASWDAPWTVRTRRVSDGWTVEMAIPFRALRFERGAGHVWGINFSRRIRRRNEVDFWAPVPRAYTLSRLSLAGDLHGLATNAAGRDLRLKPYVAARTVRETGGARFDQSGDVGADLKYGLRQGLTLDVTANPDFAQAEADVQQVNLTQFSQFFPEKREFFLENSGIFYVGDAARNNRVSTLPTPDEDLVLFFSRDIGLTPDGHTIPILAGARLTGIAGDYGIGALSIQTRATATTPANNYTVLRARRNLFAGSDVGAIFMSRQSMRSGADHNRVYGADANIRFFGRLDWSSFLIGTSAPGDSGAPYAARSSINYEGNFAHWKSGLLSIGDGFRDDLGYYRRTGVRKWFLEAGLRPRLAWLQRHGVREMHPHVSWDYYQNQRGEIIAKLLHTGYTFFLNDGGYVELSVNPNYQLLTAPFQIDPAVDSIPAGGYEWRTYRLSGSTDPSRRLSLSLEGITGGLWSGTQRTVNASLTVRPSYHFRLTAGVERTSAHLDSPPDAHFVATLWTAQANYSFTTNMYLDALSQYDPQQHLLNANIRFDLIHHALSDLFVVYNEQRFTTANGVLPGRSLIVKVTQMVGL